MALKKKAADEKEKNQSKTPAAKAQETPVKEDTKTMAVAPDKVPVVAGASVFIQDPDWLEECMEAEWDTFTSISASSGTHFTNNKEDFGKIIQFQVLYQRPVWKMSANSNDDEATDYFRSSYISEEDLNDAKQEAVEAGYEKAGVKKYLELFILMTDAEDPNCISERFIMNLAPSSVRNWKPLKGKLNTKAKMGTLETVEVVPGYPAATFQSVATPASWQGNNFTVFEFSIV